MRLLPHIIYKYQLPLVLSVNKNIVKFLEENVRETVFCLNIDNNLLKKTMQ